MPAGRRPQTLVIAEYRGIAVSSMTKLRAAREWRTCACWKNTLVRRAAADTLLAPAGRPNGWPAGVRRVGRSGCCRQSAGATSAKTDDKIIVMAGGHDGKSC